MRIRGPITIDNLLTPVTVSRAAPVVRTGENLQHLRRKRRGRKDLRITFDTSGSRIELEDSDEDSATEPLLNKSDSDSEESGIGVNTSENRNTESPSNASDGIV